METNKAKNKICEKCKVKPSTVLNRNQGYCKSCFLLQVNHKFRLNLRKESDVTPQDKALVCISGSNSSMAMLNMLNRFLLDKKEKLNISYNIKILYIDDSFILRLKEDELIKEKEIRKKLIEKILKERYNLDYEILYMEDYLKNNIKNLNLQEDIVINKFLDLFYTKIKKTGGFQRKLKRIIIQNIIFTYAIKNNYKKILFGNSGQDLVKDAFNDISTGNGINVKHYSSLCDYSYFNGKIIIIKPMKDIFTNEILLYNHYQQIDIIYPSLDYDNVEHIISSFFGKLQTEKNNTVPAVINTLNKIKDQNMNNKKCMLCLGFYDKENTILETGNKFSFNENINNNMCYQCKRIFGGFNLEKDMEDLNTFISIIQLNNLK